MKLKDQLGFIVPNDLIVLDAKPNELADMFPSDRQYLETCDWFMPREHRNVILVSFEEVKGFFSGRTKPEKLGIDLQEGVDTVNSYLKRWTAKRGFFHV